MSEPTFDELWDDAGIVRIFGTKSYVYAVGRDDLARLVLATLDRWWEECAKMSDYVSEVDDLRDELRRRVGK